MTFDLAAKLTSLNLSLPAVAAPVAAYVGYKIAGNMLYIAGQLPKQADGSIVQGLISANSDITLAVAAAQLCGLHILAQMNAAMGGDWRRLKQMVQLTGCVSATSDFKDHPKIINGASELLFNVLSERGQHARMAIGCSSLPLGAVVEVAAIAELNP